MKKPEKPKTDNLGWIMAMLFPKKNKPVSQPKQNQTWTSKPVAGTPPQANPPVTNLSQESAIPRKPATTLPADKPPLQRLSPAKSSGPRKPLLEVGKLPPAFGVIAGCLSFIVNIILIVVLVSVARELFMLKALVGNKLLGGLYENFILMDQAHIKTNITVQDNIPISFSLPISQDTIVTLTENTPINGAQVRLSSGGVVINSPANIVLPAGTNLPVHLELNVPVTTSVPIQINVPVDIPLQQTELHQPFIGLQQVVHPFYYILQPQIKSPRDLPACKSFQAFCDQFFYLP